MGREFVPGYRIRAARFEDVGFACEIARKAWAPIHKSFCEIMGEEMHEAMCTQWEKNKAGEVRGHYERTPDQFSIVEREEDTRVIGFIMFLVDEGKSLGTIGNNAIDPSHQGLGLGTAMYEHVLDLFRARGLRYASVTTGLDEGHASARRAYENAGFDVRQETVTYYRTL